MNNMNNMNNKELSIINGGALAGAFVGGFGGFVVGAVVGGFAGVYYKDPNVTKDWIVTSTLVGVSAGSVTPF